jgi:uncharacterized protein YndB with AHSA1/START domain
MKNSALLIEKILPASPDKVWRAITSKDEMKQWYFNLLALLLKNFWKNERNPE